MIIFRDNDDQPLVLGYVGRLSDEDVRKRYQTSSNHKTKRLHVIKAVLQYARHINRVKNLKELRTQRKPDSISSDYIDINDIYRDTDPANNRVGDYIKDLVILTDTPVQFCKGKQCDEDFRKFSKHKNDDNTDWKRIKTKLGRMKRFQVVDNRQTSKMDDDSSKEYHKKKQKSSKSIKKKKHFSESTESKSEESDSEEKNLESHKKTKKKYKPPKKEKRSSEESEEIKRKPKKKQLDDSSEDSVEKWNEDTESSEDSHKKKKKKKKIYEDASDETTRKIFAVENDFVLQGNKIFHAKGRRKKKQNYFDGRRRLEHFLPKRYHWDPTDIHELGYYWFNGPKGTYAAPKPLY